MKSAYSLEKKESYLFVTIIGEYDRLEFMSYGQNIIAHCKSEKIFKVLVDALQVKADLSIMERFFIGESIAELFPPHVKIAVAWPGRDLNRFAETVAVNRGSFVAVFPDLEYARKWLITPK